MKKQNLIYLILLIVFCTILFTWVDYTHKRIVREEKEYKASALGIVENRFFYKRLKIVTVFYVKGEKYYTTSLIYNFEEETGAYIRCGDTLRVFYDKKNPKKCRADLNSYFELNMWEEKMKREKLDSLIRTPINIYE